MKLHQLKYLVAIVDNHFNISAAAEAIYTSQPGISKQLRLLEEELNLRIFERNGKQLTGLTDNGEQIVLHARRALQEVENIKRIANANENTESGHFSIATTQTQAKYVLPAVFKRFHLLYPGLQIDIQQGSTEQMLHLLRKREVDFAIGSENTYFSTDLIRIPCYDWHRTLLFPRNHPLGDKKSITLADIADYPIVTYRQPKRGESGLVQAIKAIGREPNIVFTALDADIIKTYVLQGMGIGIVASMAYDPKVDRDLIGVSTRGILPKCSTWIAFNRNLILTPYMQRFIELFAPHIGRQQLHRIISGEELTASESDNLPMHNMWHI